MSYQGFVPRIIIPEDTTEQVVYRYASPAAGGAGRGPPPQARPHHEPQYVRTIIPEDTTQSVVIHYPSQLAAGRAGPPPQGYPVQTIIPEDTTQYVQTIIPQASVPAPPAQRQFARINAAPNAYGMYGGRGGGGGGEGQQGGHGRLRSACERLGRCVKGAASKAASTVTRPFRELDVDPYRVDPAADDVDLADDSAPALTADGDGEAAFDGGALAGAEGYGAEAAFGAEGLFAADAFATEHLL
eukprot:tig00001033_g6493.t1